MTVKVAFLDRDGVINHDNGYVYTIEKFKLIDGVVEALNALQEKGYALIIVTNQSGIGRGYYTEADYQKLTRYYRKALLEKGIDIVDIFHCPHSPSEHCECRKPKPGMFLQAIKKHTIDIKTSIVFGDKITDIQAAAAVGIQHGFLLGQNNQPLLSDKSIKVTIMPSLWHCVSQGKLP